MDEDKIKGYICCGLEKHPSGVMYIKMALGINIIYILEIFICVVKGGALLGLGMIVLGIAFASTLIAVILSFRISLVKADRGVVYLRYSCGYQSRFILLDVLFYIRNPSMGKSSCLFFSIFLQFCKHICDEKIHKMGRF